MRTQRRLSDSDRDERRERDRERLKHAAEQLLTGEGWQRWVRVRAQGGLARLSLTNQLLVALSCPDATFVAGFRAWLNLGYCVRKGERAIRIVAPVPIKPRDTKTDDPDDGGCACCSRASRSLTARRSRRSTACRRHRWSRPASR
jgi:hypothetical protein